MILETLAVPQPVKKLLAFQDPNFVDSGKVEMRFGSISEPYVHGAVRFSTYIQVLIYQ